MSTGDVACRFCGRAMLSLREPKRLCTVGILANCVGTEGGSGTNESEDQMITPSTCWVGYCPRCKVFLCASKEDDRERCEMPGGCECDGEPVVLFAHVQPPGTGPAKQPARRRERK